MIVATAGHVDHGKTSLIKHLTGVDTDRLEEEKRRGLSIDLGFAYRRPSAENENILGFIDVPGHQRFINTMISGVTGIDLGMLVVAADDGIMPQTGEHLDILRLLGISEIIGVISKTDRAEEARVQQVAQAVEALISSKLNIKPRLFPVSNESGEGIEALQTWLDERLEDQEKVKPGGIFRQSIDRVFTLKGIGLVVTGTILSGEISVGDTVILMPREKPLRVRSLHAQDQEVDQAGAGLRCALNITGDIEKADIQKGDWLVGPGGNRGTQCLTATMQYVDSPVKRRQKMPVKLYIGARHVPARLGFLNSGNKKKQDFDLVQVILDEAICCSRGDRFILRDYSEQFLLGGGKVLDPFASESRKLTIDYEKYLTALNLGDFSDSLETLLIKEGMVVDYKNYINAWNLSEQEAEAMLKESGIFQELEFPVVKDNQFAISSKGWEHLMESVLQIVSGWHKKHPDKTGLSQDELAGLLNQTQFDNVLPAVLDALQQRNKLSQQSGLIRITGFTAGMSDKAQQQWQQVQEVLVKQGLEIPLLSEIEKMTGIRGRELKHVINAAIKSGQVLRISPKRVGLPLTLKELADKVVEMAERQGSFSVIEFRDYIGTGRNYVIEVLDFMDTVGFTRREGNERIVQDSSVPEKVFR